MRKHLPAKEADALDKMLKQVFAERSITRSKNTVGTYRNVIVLAKEPSAGAAVDCLVIASSLTDVDAYTRCVVISLGDVKGWDDTFGAKQSIILAAGDVTGELRGSIVRTSKRVIGVDVIDRCVIIAGGGVEAKESSNNVYVNTPSSKLLRSENDREIKD